MKPCGAPSWPVAGENRAAARRAARRCARHAPVRGHGHGRARPHGLLATGHRHDRSRGCASSCAMNAKADLPIDGTAPSTGACCATPGRTAGQMAIGLLGMLMFAAHRCRASSCSPRSSCWARSPDLRPYLHLAGSAGSGAAVPGARHWRLPCDLLSGPRRPTGDQRPSAAISSRSICICPRASMTACPRARRCRG